MEVRELPAHDTISGHVQDFVQSMKEIHDHVKKTLMKANQRLKEKKDEGRRELQF